MLSRESGWCASICEYVPLFYVDTYVTWNGPPKMTCTDAYKSNGGEFFGDYFGWSLGILPGIIIIAVISMIATAFTSATKFCK